jgi:hypothetical protein
MKRWIVIVFVLIVGIAITLGSIAQIVLSLLPEDQTEGLLPFALATLVTALIGNLIVAMMQWFGKSPLDFLPEKTLKEKDPKRFKYLSVK